MKYAFNIYFMSFAIVFLYGLFYGFIKGWNDGIGEEL